MREMEEVPSKICSEKCRPNKTFLRENMFVFHQLLRISVCFTNKPVVHSISPLSHRVLLVIQMAAKNNLIAQHIVSVG